MTTERLKAITVKHVFNPDRTGSALPYEVVDSKLPFSKEKAVCHAALMVFLMDDRKGQIVIAQTYEAISLHPDIGFLMLPLKVWRKFPQGRSKIGSDFYVHGVVHYKDSEAILREFDVDLNILRDSISNNGPMVLE